MPTPHNGQAQTIRIEELFECVWPFYAVGTWMVNNARVSQIFFASINFGAWALKRIFFVYWFSGIGQNSWNLSQFMLRKLSDFKINNVKIYLLNLNHEDNFRPCLT